MLPSYQFTFNMNLLLPADWSLAKAQDHRSAASHQLWNCFGTDFHFFQRCVLQLYQHHPMPVYVVITQISHQHIQLSSTIDYFFSKHFCLHFMLKQASTPPLPSMLQLRSKSHSRFSPPSSISPLPSNPTSLNSC